MIPANSDMLICIQNGVDQSLRWGMRYGARTLEIRGDVRMPYCNTGEGVMCGCAAHKVLRLYGYGLFVWYTRDSPQAKNICGSLILDLSQGNNGVPLRAIYRYSEVCPSLLQCIHAALLRLCSSFPLYVIVYAT